MGSPSVELAVKAVDANCQTQALPNVERPVHLSTTTFAHDFTRVVGSVLAPDATVSGVSSGKIDGTLIANSFTGPTEFHNVGYEGQLPTPTPESASYVCIGAGLIGFAAVSKKRFGR